MELSPVAVTRATRWFTTEIKFGVPLRFALGRLNEMPWAHSKTVLASRLFALSRYRLGERDNFSAPWEMLIRMTAEHVAVRPENVQLFPGFPAGKEPPAAALLYLNMMGPMEAELFTAYNIDPAMESYAHSIIRRGKKLGIPVIFWRPPVHPLWQSVLNKHLNQTQWDRLILRLENEGGHYLDLGAPGVMQCNYFFDPVHFGQNCIPEIFYRKLQLYESIQAKEAGDVD